MGLGDRIHELRLGRGESLQQVADAVGVSKAHIWELEKGRTDNPSMGLVTRLADHFAVSIRYLVDEDVEAPDADEDLARMFRQARDLDAHDRRVLDDMLQSFRRRRPDQNAT
ncbi:MAG: helix-turn-helix domain-containing protein [Alphaproteobacteria bacterium]